MAIASKEESTPIRAIVRRLESILKEGELPKLAAEDLQDCISDLMQLAKRYEPMKEVKRE